MSNINVFEEIEKELTLDKFLSIVKGLNTLSKNIEKFISSLSLVRNKFVHDILILWIKIYLNLLIQ